MIRRGALHLQKDPGCTMFLVLVQVFLKSSWSLRPCLSDEFSNHSSGLCRHFDRREAFGTTAPLNVLFNMPGQIPAGSGKLRLGTIGYQWLKQRLKGVPSVW